MVKLHFYTIIDRIFRQLAILIKMRNERLFNVMCRYSLVFACKAYRIKHPLK